jgi:hypothetical protein
MSRSLVFRECAATEEDCLWTLRTGEGMDISAVILEVRRAVEVDSKAVIAFVHVK